MSNSKHMSIETLYCSNPNNRISLLSYRYLNKVYPELEIPGKRPSRIQYEKSILPPPQTLVEGSIKVTGLDICLMGDNNMKSTELTAGGCSQDEQSRNWRLTDAGDLL